MADEEELDDLDSDFEEDDDLNLDADLEDIMGGDLDDGEEENSDDNELDSFFEDLSSIEDLETPESGELDTSKPAESKEAKQTTSVTEPVTPKKSESTGPPPKVEPFRKKQKKGKKILIFILIFLMLGGGLWWFFSNPEQINEVVDQTGEPEDNLLIESIDEDDNLIVLEPPEKEIKQVAPNVNESQKLELTKNSDPKLVPIKPKKPPFQPRYDPNGEYLVQIVACSFNPCIQTFTRRLKQLGYPTRKASNMKKIDMIELVSNQVYDVGLAEEYATIINQQNTKTGFAKVVSKSNGYAITMGRFPQLETAKEVKFHLDRIIPDQQLTFGLKHVEEIVTGITKVYVGPYKTKKGANYILQQMKLRNEFEDAFVTRR